MVSLFMMLSLTYAETPVPVMQDTYEMIRAARSTESGWTDEVQALALEWGLQLYSTMNLLRLGDSKLAADGIATMTETLGELNFRLQFVPNPEDAVRVASLAVDGVAQAIRQKLGRLGSEESRLMSEAARALVLRLDDSGKVIAAGNAAIAPDVRVYRNQRRLRVLGNTGVLVSTFALCAYALVTPAETSLQIFQKISSGASVAAAMAFARATQNIGRTPPRRPSAKDIDYLRQSLLRLPQIFSAPNPAATPSVVSRAG